MKKILFLFALFLAFSLQGYAQGDTGQESEFVAQAKWDWSSTTGATRNQTTTAIEGTTAWLKSDHSKETEEKVETSIQTLDSEQQSGEPQETFESTKDENFADYQMYVDATSGKLQNNGNGGAQFNTGLSYWCLSSITVTR